MRVIYENTEINIQVSDCKVIDNMGGKADSLAITFADIKNECRKWGFKKNHTIEVIEEPFSTGKMYVDEFGCGVGIYSIRALSIKKKVKTKFTRTWESVRFLALVNDLIKDEGLKLETYGTIENYEYARVDQIEKNNIEFLNERCILEGYNLKICDGKAIIVSEVFLEGQKESLTLDPSMFVGKYNFNCISKDIYSGCEINYASRKFIKGNCILNRDGELLKLRNIMVSNSYEADRFAKNILRSYNKYEITGTFYLNKNAKVAAGATVKIENLDSFNGKYIVDRVYQDFIQGKTKVRVRKVLEGF
ncbi:hypothetical protein psyc5s11_44900 [Clostridium gelidum]|uniref:Phage late control gene D protein (GPD) n=1 Tax=Clostridium gelidum TaxID=704125 RepID=A0ABM7TIV5_9CLOT|nr:hypothetical protein [Clostridium gelidum]BCZ48423.1 hypothetical protein psyc5s11_44900 [Clostridium gelidum]